MRKRKRIAVLMAGVDREYQHALTKGMALAARTAGADLCIFNCQGQPDGFVRNDRGERAIFTLPDLHTFDGAVALLATIPTKVCRDQIRAMLNQRPEMPLVTIDVRHGQSVQLGFDDVSSVRELITHLLDVHGARSLAVVTGPMESWVSVMRYEATCEVLRERGIVLPENAVYDGRWGREGGRAAAESFLEKLEKMPDAIVCGNDDMAFGLYEGLQAAGLRVPEDVLVTGFDAREEAVGRGLTTIRRPVHEAGELAVNTLLDWMENGRPKEDNVTLPTHLIYGDSCGCPLHPSRAASCIELMSSEHRLIEKVLRQTTEFTTMLANVSTQRQAGEQLTEFARMWYAKEMHVCVVPNYMNGETEQFPETYPEEMLLLSGWSGDREILQQRFHTKQLVPRLEEERDEPLALVFSPLHYMENNIGYLVFDVEHVVSTVLPSLLLLMSSSLMSLYLRTTIQNYMSTLENISIHDELTGLHNRRGMKQLLPPVFEQAREEKRPFAVVCCDMDDLKAVNDNFGHQAGDQAIERLGRAIRVLEEYGLTCIHISGDEFLILGMPDVPCTAEQLLERLRASLELLNEEEWYCKISASMGAYTAVPGEGERMEDFIRHADNGMYAQKHLHHRRLGRKPEGNPYL